MDALYSSLPQLSAAERSEAEQSFASCTCRVAKGDLLQIVTCYDLSPVTNFFILSFKMLVTGFGKACEPYL